MNRRNSLRLMVTLLVAMDAMSAWAQGGTTQSETSGTPSQNLETIPVAALPEKTEKAGTEEKADSPVQLDAVVVTAGKRKQDVTKVAGSVNALTGKELEKIKAQSLSDYLKLVPGVVIADRGAESGGVTIRGIASQQPVAGIGGQFTQLPVGTYIDDLPLADLFVPLSVPDLNPFDLERVEVLKGPQSTLFGSGALSGAIRYILQKPELETYEGKFSATFNSTPYSDGLSPVYALAANAPIGETAAVRIAGVARKNSGMIDDARLGKDIDKVRQDTGRVLGKWDVTEALKLGAFVFKQKTDLANGPSSDNPRTLERSNSGLTSRRSGFTGGNFTAGYDFAPLSLLSTTSYNTKSLFSIGFLPAGGSDPNGDPDGDGGENGTGTEDLDYSDFQSTAVGSRTKNLFQELRIASPEGADWSPASWLGVKWLGGLSYQRSQQHVINDERSPRGEPIDGLPDLPDFPVADPLGLFGDNLSDGNSTVYIDYDSVAKEKAIYGEFTAKLFEQLELTMGARYFETRLHTVGFLSGAFTLALTGMPRVDVDQVFAEKGVTPKASLRYTFNDNLQIYALAAKGFQFGGIQIQVPSPIYEGTVPEGYNPYKSSKLWNYELGLRTEFFQRRLGFNITAFYLDWKDLQISIPRPLLPELYQGSPNITPAFVENIGSASSRGVETALSIKPVRGLSFTSSASWVHAVTDEDFNTASGLVLKGTRLPGSPEFQMANVLAYSVPPKLLPWMDLDLRLTHSHTGGSFNNLQYYRKQGDFDTMDVGLSVGKRTWFGKPVLSLNLVNITDVRGAANVGGSSSFRDVDYYFTRPRTLIASLGLGF